MRKNLYFIHLSKITSESHAVVIRYLKSYFGDEFISAVSISLFNQADWRSVERFIKEAEVVVILLPDKWASETPLHENVRFVLWKTFEFQSQVVPIALEYSELPTELNRPDLANRDAIILKHLDYLFSFECSRVAEYEYTYSLRLLTHRIVKLLKSEETRIIGKENLDGDYPPENLQFTTYCPHACGVKWERMLIFTHLDSPIDGDDDDPVELVQSEAKATLKNEYENYSRRTKDSSLSVPRDSELSFVPNVPGLQFNPPRRGFIWADDMNIHKEEFLIRCVSSWRGVDRSVNGFVTVYLGGIITAEIPIRIRVSANVVKAGLASKVQSVSPYRNIFPSYSRKDLAIVRQLEKYARTFGDEYLRDTMTLRSGEDWNEGIMECIYRADVFQLFWSTNSMCSKNVSAEWNHALSLERDSFIRPTCWEIPTPKIPNQLEHIHFHHYEFTDDGLESNKQIPSNLPDGNERSSDEESASNMSKCHEGVHWFDNNKFSECPYCRSAGFTDGNWDDFDDRTQVNKSVPPSLSFEEEREPSRSTDVDAIETPKHKNKSSWSSAALVMVAFYLLMLLLVGAFFEINIF